MKKILMGLIAAATLVGFVAPSFADEAAKPAAEGEKTEKKAAKKAKKEKKEAAPKAEEKPAEAAPAK